MLGLRIAAQIAVVATAPDTVQVNVPFNVTVQVSAPANTRPALQMPNVGRLRVVDVRRVVAQLDTTRLGGAWRRTEWRFVFEAPVAGRVVVPSFEARAGRAIGRSLPLPLRVVDAREPVALPAVVTRASLDTAGGIAFHALVLPETVYVGQQATYQVGVFLESGVRQRLRRNPEFVPPEVRAMLAYDLPPSAPGPLLRRVGSRRYDVHVFERALFPLAAGGIEIPPARLVYSLPLSSSFFSREESHTARSAPQRLVVRDVPAEGRPADWAGAVGALAVRARLDSLPRVGDPLLLTVAVTGRANVKLLPRPDVAIPWATVVAADERVRLDSVPGVVRGTKEFDYIVTPRVAGGVTMPAVRYPVFNPYTERYEILATAPESLDVAQGTLAAAEPASDTVAPLLGLRPVLRPAAPPPPYESRWFWLAGFLAPLPAAGMWVARQPRRARVVTSAARLRALAGSRQPPAPGLLRKTYARALADRLALSAAVLTERDALAHALRRAGVTPETATAAASLLAELSDAAWAGRERLHAGAPRRALELYRAVDAEARRDPRAPLPRAARSAGRALALLLAIGIAGAAGVAFAAAQRDEARDLFARASQLYEGRRAAEATRLFAAVALREPDAPDAWANYGTSAWAAGDTTAAVVGWQRALRLEPLAFDVRERLALPAAPDPVWEAVVPPVPPAHAAVAALACWLLAWTLAAAAARRPRPAARAWGIACGTAAFVLAGAASTAYAARDARDLVVLDRATLRISPALGAEAVPGGVTAGTVAATTRRQGVWYHVALGDGRRGWVTGEAVHGLARRDGPVAR